MGTGTGLDLFELGYMHGAVAFAKEPTDDPEYLSGYWAGLRMEGSKWFAGRRDDRS